MMKVLMFVAVIATLSSCTSLNRSMKEPNTRVNLNKTDFTLSDQVSAEATSTKILNIDFARLFNKTTGTIESSSVALSAASIPVVGSLLMDKTANYALYNMMNATPGYDVVFYPQYETKVSRPIGLGFIYKITTVKATARLGKLNK